MANQKKRILFVDHVSSLAGGAQRGLVDIVRSLDRTCYESTVVIPSGGRLAEAVAAQGAGVAYAPMRRFKKTVNPATLAGYALSLTRVAPRIAALIREHGIEVVHANGDRAHMYAMAAAGRAGVPVVWHCRDLAGLRILGKWMYRAASRVIAISHTVARHLDQYAGGARGNKVTVIHNGIDPESLRGGDQGMAFRGEMGIAPEKFVVAIIGQMVPWKNHVVFLSAARRVAAEFPRAHFLIVGDDMFGEWAGYVESLKAQSRASGLGGRTTFAGFREDMGRVLGGIDVLVHPADREPFGRVIVESMAMGKPVVAVDRCGPAEIIRNGTDGILAKNADPDELAEGVLRLARDRAFYRKISASARARARNDFSLSRCVNEIRQVYDEVTETG